jgi:hypothetical protein
MSFQRYAVCGSGLFMAIPAPPTEPPVLRFGRLSVAAHKRPKSAGHAGKAELPDRRHVGKQAGGQRKRPRQISTRISDPNTLDDGWRWLFDFDARAGKFAGLHPSLWRFNVAQQLQSVAGKTDSHGRLSREYVLALTLDIQDWVAGSQRPNVHAVETVLKDLASALDHRGKTSSDRLVYLIMLTSTTLRRNLNSPRAAKPWAGCLSVS